MSLYSFILPRLFAKGDAKRDEGLTTPDSIERVDNLSYNESDSDNWHLLDIYYPKGTTKPLPTIVSIHGGGFVYGTKEVYQYYLMSMAERGFTCVNFNYPLAPKNKYPAPLVATNDVMNFILKNAEKYNIDANNIFAVGDSAGAQLLSQYSAMLTNKEYAKLFGFEVADVSLNAIALNCGVYELEKSSLNKDYIGKINKLPLPVKTLDVLGHITKDYPPVFLMTAFNDPLKENTEPMRKKLNEIGVEMLDRCYGDAEHKEISHVFHCNVRLDEGIKCNDDEAEFFKKHIK